jgi:CheY-like chemotaxis protein
MVVASDGNAALTFCHVENFSMLIVDHLLPGMSGLQFIKAVRLMDRYRNVPAVMVTAETDPRLREEARAAGVTDFLHKPVEAMAFRKLIADHLGAAAIVQDLPKSA